MDNVNHPAHYNAPGRKECIVEMLEIFGSEKVQIFCELNAYKYKYRHEMKNGQEDLDKAAWYEAKQAELAAADERFEIAKHFGLDKQKNQLIEEMAELTQAICKCKRAQTTFSPNLIEEIADVKLVIEQLIYLLACEEDVIAIEKQKIRRTLERIGEGNESN